MGRTKKNRRSKKRSASNTTWIVAGLVGGIVLVVAALALFSRGDDQPGQKAFDPDFEPMVKGAPRVEVLPDPVVDYGDVKLNTTITTTYTVRNVGDKPLYIYGEPRVELVEGC